MLDVIISVCRLMCVEHKYIFYLVDGVSSFIGELHSLSLGLSDKNPISALHELCTKLHWEKPLFEMHEQDVTLPKFLMKVLYNFSLYLIIFGFHIHFIPISVTFMKLITS